MNRNAVDPHIEVTQARPVVHDHSRLQRNPLARIQGIGTPTLGNLLAVQRQKYILVGALCASAKERINFQGSLLYGHISLQLP